MTITLELSPEMESALSALAAARGVALPDVIRGLLENQLPKAVPSVAAWERAEAWRAAARGLRDRPVLPDEAMSRSAIYGGPE